jgi:hypothetical protein
MAEFKPDDQDTNTGQPKKDLSPIPFDDDGPETEISHAPLNLGGTGSSAPAPAAKPTPKPAPVPTPAAAAPKPVVRPQAPAASADRITGVKIFFTKLHAGAMDFLSEQISDWLASNPNVVVKHTNTAVGEVAAKKTEPNLIVTIWY